MRHPALPDARRRIQAAQVYGEVQRLCFGQDQADQLERDVARLHEITTDPVVLGHALGYTWPTPTGPATTTTCERWSSSGRRAPTRNRRS